MPRGVPYRVRVQLLERVSRSYTLTEVAIGTGLSLALVSLIFNHKRPITLYAAMRLSEFFGITIEQLFTPGTIVVETPAPRPLGRIIARIRPRSRYRFAGRVTDPVSQMLEALERELRHPSQSSEP